MTFLLVILAVLVGICIGTMLKKEPPVKIITKKISRINPIGFSEGRYDQYKNEREMDFYKEFPSMLDQNVEYSNSTIQIGDRVKVYDGSANYDAQTFKSRHGVDSLFLSAAKVIDTSNENFIVMDRNFNVLYNCDLLLQFPAGEQVWINSDHVRKVS